MHVIWHVLELPGRNQVFATPSSPEWPVFFSFLPNEPFYSGFCSKHRIRAYYVGMSASSTDHEAPFKALQNTDPMHKQALPVFVALSPPPLQLEVEPEAPQAGRWTGTPSGTRRTAALLAASSAYLKSDAISEIVDTFVKEEDAVWGRLRAGWSSRFLYLLMAERRLRRRATRRYWLFVPVPLAVGSDRRK